MEIIFSELLYHQNGPKAPAPAGLSQNVDLLRRVLSTLMEWLGKTNQGLQRNPSNELTTIFLRLGPLQENLGLKTKYANVLLLIETQND